MQQATKLILLRHGQSVWNKKNLFTGWVDIPLSEEGIVEARKAGKQIKDIKIDLLPPTKRLFTVGRLDKNTRGLLFITNDGYFANSVTHPSYNVEKEYLVVTKQKILSSHLRVLQKGALVENQWCTPKKVTQLSNYSLTIALTEGKKHEVRIFVKHASLTLLDLIRIRIGPISLSKSLKEGCYRKMSPQEISFFLKDSI